MINKCFTVYYNFLLGNKRKFFGNIMSNSSLEKNCSSFFFKTFCACL